MHGTYEAQRVIEVQKKGVSSTFIFGAKGFAEKGDKLECKIHVGIRDGFILSNSTSGLNVHCNKFDVDALVRFGYMIKV